MEIVDNVHGEGSIASTEAPHGAGGLLGGIVDLLAVGVLQGVLVLRLEAKQCLDCLYYLKYFTCYKGTRVPRECVTFDQWGRQEGRGEKGDPTCWTTMVSTRVRYSKPDGTPSIGGGRGIHKPGWDTPGWVV